MSKQWVVSSFGSSVGINNQASSKKRRRENYKKVEAFETTSRNDLKLHDILWVNKYKPNSENDLAVNKKKVDEVRQCLKNLFFQKHCNILLITGPSGVGKTATIRVLSEEMRFEINEWSNAPTLSYVHDEQVFGESQLAGFREFLLLTSKYSSSQIFKDDNKYSKNIVLLEEFPNVIYRNLHEFWEILRLYNKFGNNPLVIIITDDSKDATNERKLFPKDVQEELRITNISFNQIANSFLSRSLKRIVEAENVEVSMEVIEDVAKNSQGDIRTAINSLQFNLDNFNIKKHNRTKLLVRPSKSAKLEPSKKSSLAALGSRDESFFIFHALGKMLHCKRADSLDKALSLPATLKEMERKPLLINPEDIWYKTTTSANNFVAFLHHNYPPFIADIGNLEKSAAYLSVADVYSSEWTGSGSDTSPLDSFTFSVAARGIIFSKTEGSVGWKSLTKPEYFDVEKTRIRNIKHGIDIFREPMLRVSDNELFSEIIPFICKIRPCKFSIDQIKFSLQMGATSRNLSLEESYEVNKNTYAKSEKDLPKEQNLNEYEIEEFDD